MMDSHLLPHLFFLIPPFAGGLVLFLLYHRIRGVTASLAALGVVLLQLPGYFVHEFIPTAAGLSDASTSFFLPFSEWGSSLAFLIVIQASATLALLYAWREEAEHPRSANYYAFLLLLTGSLNFTILVNQFLAFIIGWEVILVVSSLLIAHWGKADNCRVIARKYFIFSLAASLCLITALVLIANHTGQQNMLQQVDPATLPEGLLSTITILITIGFFIKLAVFPLHIWLPDAYTAAAMPVTIMLACAMLPLGVYGILRIGNDMLHMLSYGPTQSLFFGAGLLSKLVGAVLAARASEFKRVIAYSSISQAGILLICLGLSSPAGFAAVVFHVLIHAPIKALLFITIGEVIERSRHITVEAAQIPIQTNRIVFAAFCIAAAALSGVPPLAGFSSEWFIANAGFRQQVFWVIAIMLLLSVFTAIYLIRVLMSAFSSQSHHPLPPPNRHNERAIPVMILSAAIIIGQSIFAQPIYQWLVAIWGGD
ncbi:MAG: NADH dehydrogenase [Anaerolineae bacterium]|nr:NADH dehydrogenase [Anaerolineae bacterium]